MNLHDPEVEIEFTRAYTRVIKFLSFRPRSIQEIEQFLAKKKFEDLIIQKVIELLIEQKLLNDKEFAQWWIEQRQEMRAKSKSFIKHELKQKGIDEHTIEETLDNARDDYKTALQFFEKRKKRFENLKGQEYVQKVSAFLQRRGFSWDIVKRVINEYNK